jgi:hypothetical protein
MEFVIVAIVVLVMVTAVWLVARQRRRFDETVAPADDLRRADDGERRGLAERDGTGGMI